MCGIIYSIGCEGHSFGIDSSFPVMMIYMVLVAVFDCRDRIYHRDFVV